MFILTIPVSPFEQNCRILADNETKEAVIVDPGDEIPRISSVVNQYGWKVTAIWLTHSHIDHAACVADALDLFKVPLYGHEAEKQMREFMPMQGQMYGFPKPLRVVPEPDHYIAHADTLTIGSITAKTLFTPGHSPGHVSFYFEPQTVIRATENGVVSEVEAPVCVAGDALFAGSIGRTDLPGGNHDQLISSIQTHLMPLPDDTLVLSGHGPDTCVGEERRSNPFLI